MNQKSKSEFWINEAGHSIPYNRTTKVERLMESKSKLLLKKAREVNKRMLEFKKEMEEISMEVYRAFMEEKEVKTDRKGNFTWYNFGRTIKVEIAINEAITFDDLTIQAAKEKLDQFLQESIESKVDYLKEMVMDAFATSRGKLDTGKVLSLIKYKSKVKNENYSAAMELIGQSIRRPSSKTYYRISEKNESGEYKNVELNFSAL